MPVFRRFRGEQQESPKPGSDLSATMGVKIATAQARQPLLSQQHGHDSGGCVIKGPRSEARHLQGRRPRRQVPSALRVLLANRPSRLVLQPACEAR